MKYRSEIDGLRALAVVPVILFHAGFNAFSGGFVGVDVFFVISGYLITTILLNDLEAGKFSIVHFYERRARRILPALFLVMFACLPFAWFWLLPQDLKSFSQSLVAVSVYASNILFWRTSGYFDTATELKPLIHTWSLSIEEQYYVLFPLFLFFAWRLGKRWTVGILVVVAVISLALAQSYVNKYPSFTFYMLPTRAWELLIGAFVAFYYSEHNIKKHKYWASELGSLLGFALIAYAIFAFSEKTPFPSIYALVPTVGAALIIVFATNKTLIGRLLSTKPFLWVGLISYSAYLWHQPLFAFARHRSLEEPSQVLLAVLAVITLPLAYLTWRFVERPFRNKHFISRRAVFAFAFCVSAVFISLGILGNLKEGFTQRFDLNTLIKQSFDRPKADENCFDRDMAHKRIDWVCTIGSTHATPDFVVFGDSHSLSLLDVFDRAAKLTEHSGYFVGTSGCTPFLGIHSLRGDQDIRNCNLLNIRVFDLVKEKKIKKIYLVARWTYYTDGGYSGKNFSFIGLNPTDEPSMLKSRKAFEAGLENTINAYKSIGTKIVIILQVPQQKTEPKQAYYKLTSSNQLSQDNIRKLSISRQEHNSLQAFTNEIFTKKSSASNVEVLDFVDAFCDSEKCILGNTEGSYYLDNDHLSTNGSLLILEAIKSTFFK